MSPDIFKNLNRSRLILGAGVVVFILGATVGAINLLREAPELAMEPPAPKPTEQVDRAWVDKQARDVNRLVDSIARERADMPAAPENAALQEFFARDLRTLQEICRERVVIYNARKVALPASVVVRELDAAVCD